MPILVDLRCFHGLQQDLFRFRNAIFFSVNVGQDAAGLATNVHDGGQVLAQEPLKQKKSNFVGFCLQKSLLLWKLRKTQSQTWNFEKT
jgi:hypothetical protein